MIDLRSGKRVASAATRDFLYDIVLTRRGSVGMIHRKQLTLVRNAAVEVLDSAAELHSLAYAARQVRPSFPPWSPAHRFRCRRRRCRRRPCR